MITCKCRCWC